MTETSRRGFLKGLLGLTVVALVPLPKTTESLAGVKPIDPFAIKAPEGTTYQWVRTSLMGDPDPENVRLRLTNGWKFVMPAEQPTAPTSELGNAVENGGLVLMQKPTVEVQDEYARDWKRRNLVAIAHDEDGQPIAWQYPDTAYPGRRVGGPPKATVTRVPVIKEDFDA